MSLPGPAAPVCQVMFELFFKSMSHVSSLRIELLAELDL
jgi:hypothetical protein